MTTGVRAIIIKQGKIIMVSHHESEFGDLWLLPGGGVEEGESILQAAEREVFEETKLVVRAKSIVYIREVSYRKEFGVEFYVLCDYVSGDLDLGYDPEHAPDKQILKGVKEILVEDLKNYSFKPRELEDLLVEDLKQKNNFKHIKYLGLVDLG